MGYERSIVQKLFESRDLNEASFESGGSTYKCAFGRYYKDDEPISRDEYMKAKGNQSSGNSPEKSDDVSLDLLRAKQKEINKSLKAAYARGDKEAIAKIEPEEERIRNAIKKLVSKPQEPTPVHNEETRVKAIKNPEEKKVFIAVSDAMAEYGGQISGDRETDGAAKRYYADYINTGNAKSLKKVADIMYDLTGSPEYRMKAPEGLDDATVDKYAGPWESKSGDKVLDTSYGNFRTAYAGYLQAKEAYQKAYYKLENNLRKEMGLPSHSKARGATTPEFRKAFTQAQKTDPNYKAASVAQQKAMRNYEKVGYKFKKDYQDSRKRGVKSPHAYYVASTEFDDFD